ncbi:hypothetical protein HMPREF0322_04103 [Desulfitobacterium hafniense DP7]|uniref:Uncharacterized protein n=1 Tax=Desulfitobacterium hafniense DP7 TaxID=537010 RepID=G9XSZ7_DESHA|nr:hypothetical protein HMPREF0322_04103 [Desulfitobacterium hafniense DP7]
MLSFTREELRKFVKSICLLIIFHNSPNSEISHNEEAPDTY